MNATAATLLSTDGEVVPLQGVTAKGRLEGLLVGGIYMFFSNTGCTGQAYTNVPAWKAQQGYVFSELNGSLYYVPRGTTCVEH